ncbi:MAG: glycosyltransferase family 39 protein [Elusimicrobia bacterium]|nr:glycosyltransferase family 39 protein [Elusimicrobiota bacterium]
MTRHTAAPKGTDYIKGLSLSVLAVGVFNLIWFDRYFSVCEGWFSAYSQRWISGYLPYKDTALFLPPLYPFQLVVWTKLFGPSFIALRIMGVLVLMLLTFVIYSIFRRITSSLGASISAFISVLCFESFNVFIPYDYHSFDTLYAAVSVLFVMNAFDASNANNRPLKENLFVALAGFFASCCILVKHSLGGLLILTVSLLLFMAYYHAPSIRRLKAGCFFVLGLIIPIGIFCLWLFNFSSAAGFYKAVILGVGAKGSWISILFGFLRFQLTIPFFVQILLSLLILCFFLCFKEKTADKERGEVIGWLPISIVMFFVVLNHLLVRWPFPVQSAVLVNNISAPVIPLAIIGTLLVLGRIPRLLRDNPDNSAFNALAVAFLSLCLMYSTAMSTMISAPGVFVGLGLVICLLYNRLRYVKWGLISLLFCLFIYTESLVFSKYHRPYSWWYVGSSDIRGELEGFNLPLLKGIYTTRENKEAIEQITRTILDETKPGEHIYAYPSIPLFYILSDRWPPTYSLQHWYDTVSDSLVKEDLAALKADPPKIIVMLDLPEAAVKVHELLFRGGRPCVQREIIRWISEQADPKTGVYRTRASYIIGNNAVLRVWKHV